MSKYLILLMFLLNACVTYDNFDLSKADGAYGMAKALEDDERYEEALMQYQSLKNRFPYSKYATEAELQIAEIHFKKESFIEAQGAYQLFKELHPNHGRIDYVTFQIGESLYKQLPSTIDRDLSVAPLSIKEFNVLMRDFPSSTHKVKASERKKEIINMLADKELYIADFYFRADEPLHALIRYEKFLKEFPQHEKRAHAFFRAGMAAEKNGDQSKRNVFLRKLVSEHPDSKEAKKAKGIF